MRNSILEITPRIGYSEFFMIYDSPIMISDLETHLTVQLWPKIACVEIICQVFGILEDTIKIYLDHKKLVSFLPRESNEDHKLKISKRQLKRKIMMDFILPRLVLTESDEDPNKWTLKLYSEPYAKRNFVNSKRLFNNTANVILEDVIIPRPNELDPQPQTMLSGRRGSIIGGRPGRRMSLMDKPWLNATISKQLNEWLTTFSAAGNGNGSNNNGNAVESTRSSIDYAYLESAPLVREVSSLENKTVAKPVTRKSAMNSGVDIEVIMASKEREKHIFDYTIDADAIKAELEIRGKLAVTRDRESATTATTSTTTAAVPAPSRLLQGLHAAQSFNHNHHHHHTHHSHRHQHRDQSRSPESVGSSSSNSAVSDGRTTEGDVPPVSSSPPVTHVTIPGYNHLKKEKPRPATAKATYGSSLRKTAGRRSASSSRLYNKAAPAPSSPPPSPLAGGGISSSLASANWRPMSAPPVIRQNIDSTDPNHNDSTAAAATHTTTTTTAAAATASLPPSSAKSRFRIVGMRKVSSKDPDDDSKTMRILVEVPSNDDLDEIQPAVLRAGSASMASASASISAGRGAPRPFSAVAAMQGNPSTHMKSTTTTRGNSGSGSSRPLSPRSLAIRRKTLSSPYANRYTRQRLGRDQLSFLRRPLTGYELPKSPVHNRTSPGHDLHFPSLLTTSWMTSLLSSPSKVLPTTSVDLGGDDEAW